MSLFREYIYDVGRIIHIFTSFAIVTAGALTACDLHTLHEPDSHIPLNDTETPFAGVPRIVIETEKHTEVLDRVNEIPAHLQIYGASSAMTDVYPITIRGRGNTSWEGTDKKSYKIELTEKVSLLDMPKNKDWALISNFSDKTLMKNFIVYKLARKIGLPHTPRASFAELYLNGEYLGLYTLTETIKVGKNRVNIPENDQSYLVEIDNKYRKNEIVIFSDMDMPFRIHSPKKADKKSQVRLLKHLNDFENYLAHIDSSKENHVEEWIDIENYVKHYWIQELTKNPDGGFFSSVFFTWQEGGVIQMGPVWDFDLSLGGHTNNKVNTVDGFHIRGAYWNEYIFKDEKFGWEINKIWHQYKKDFESILDTMDVSKKYIRDAALQNFKRWPGIVNDYDKSVEETKLWLSNRIKWLNKVVPEP